MPAGRSLPARFCPWDGAQYGEKDLCCRVCGSERTQTVYGGEVDLGELVHGRAKDGPRWRKILYEKQAFPDNYTDHTFLQGLRRNVNKRTYDYWTLVCDSSAVTQQISIVTLFVVLFIESYNQGAGLGLTAEVLVVLQAVFVAIGYAVQRYCTLVAQNRAEAAAEKAVQAAPLSPASDSPTSEEGLRDSASSGSSDTADGTPCGAGLETLFARNLSSLLVLVGVLLALSPVLATLTNAFSDDTIWVLSILLMLIHVVFHDYGYIIGSSEKFEAPVSLNAAVFASVLLGSRLQSNLHVFTLIMLAVELFALFPIMRHHLRETSMDAHLWLTFGMFLCGAVLISPVSPAAAFSFVFIIFFITFASPFWLIWVQKYKNEINGPWDEAIPSSTAGYYHPQQDQ